MSLPVENVAKQMSAKQQPTGDQSQSATILGIVAGNPFHVSKVGCLCCAIFCGLDSLGNQPMVFVGYFKSIFPSRV